LRGALSVKGPRSQIAPRNHHFYAGWALIEEALNTHTLPSIEERSRKDRTFKTTFVYDCYLLDLMLTKRGSETDFCANILNFPPFIPYRLDHPISDYSADDHQVAQKLSQVYLLDNSDTEHHACPFPTFGFTCKEHSREYTPFEHFYAANPLSLFEEITGINFKHWATSAFTNEPEVHEITSSLPQKFDILILGRKSGKAPKGRSATIPFPCIIIDFDIATDTVLTLQALYQEPGSIYAHGTSGPAIQPMKLSCKFMPTSNRMAITPSDEFAFARIFRRTSKS